MKSLVVIFCLSLFTFGAFADTKAVPALLEKTSLENGIFSYGYTAYNASPDLKENLSFKCKYTNAIKLFGKKSLKSVSVSVALTDSFDRAGAVEKRAGQLNIHDAVEYCLNKASLTETDSNHLVEVILPSVSAWTSAVSPK